MAECNETNCYQKLIAKKPVGLGDDALPCPLPVVLPCPLHARIMSIMWWPLASGNTTASDATEGSILTNFEALA